MKKELRSIVVIPQGVTVVLDGGMVKVKGAKGEVVRPFAETMFTVALSKEAITLSCARATKREKSRMYSWRAHLTNMIRGVQTPAVYKLKVCASHFPMQVVTQKGTFTVKNFVGEKTPRTTKLPANVTVSVDGDIVTVTSPDYEIAGRTAGLIEHLMVIRDKDRRIFQDGIYITEKNGEAIV